MTAVLADPRLTSAEVFAILDDARTWPRCPECDGIHLDPFVDVNPARIPQARSLDRVEQFLDRQDTTLLPSTQTRIACPTPAVAETTAALLRGLGAPARAVYIGGTT